MILFYFYISNINILISIFHDSYAKSWFEPWSVAHQHFVKEN